MAAHLTIADLRTAALEEAWIAINAEGGFAPPSDAYAKGYDDAIGKALDIIERLGGFDPGALIIRELERAA